MPIVIVSRDWIGAPSIVRVETTDTISEVLSNGYLESQKDNIKHANTGEFDWEYSDMVAIVASDGKGIFNLVNGNLTPIGGGLSLALKLEAADVLGMYANPVSLIPAVEGKQIIVRSVLLKYTHDTASFAAGGPILLQYGDDANGAGIPASAELAAATLNGFAVDSSVSFAGLSAAGALSDKQGVGIYISNKTAAFTTGDGEVEIIAQFSVV